MRRTTALYGDEEQEFTNHIVQMTIEEEIDETNDDEELMIKKKLI